MVRLLLDGGTDVNYQGYDGKTPLSIACSFIHQTDDDGKVLFLVKLLLRHGANTNIQDINGRTPLMHAFRYGSSSEVVNLLLENDAQLEICDKNGMRALDFLNYKSFQKYAECLNRFLPVDEIQGKSEPPNKSLEVPVVIIDYASPKYIAYDREEIFFQFPTSDKRDSISMKSRPPMLNRRKSEAVCFQKELNKRLQTKKTSFSRSLPSMENIEEFPRISNVDGNTIRKNKVTPLPKLPPINHMKDR